MLAIIFIVAIFIKNIIKVEDSKKNIQNNIILSDNKEIEKNILNPKNVETKKEEKKEEVKKQTKKETKVETNKSNKKKEKEKINKENKQQQLKKTTNTKSIFSASKIPSSVLKKMIGNSIPEKSKNKVNTDKLSYLKITYWGFDEKSHVGEMVVNKKLAQEVLDIFKEVYKKKYPIEKIRLIDEYGANDEKSMRNNNSSAFCYRVVANTTTLSNHSLGTAIDINPLYNPYVVGKYISPTTGSKYVDRTLNKKGMIKKGDDLYNAFIKRGWTWGGSWKSKKDYQHFEKNI